MSALGLARRAAVAAAVAVLAVTVPLAPATGTFSFTRRDPALTKLAFTIWTSTDLEDWTEDAEATLAARLPEVDALLVAALQSWS